MRDLMSVVEKAPPITSPLEPIEDILRRNVLRTVPFGVAKSVSFDLATVLERCGYPARVLRCSQALFKAPNADPRWLKLDPLTWEHYVVLVGERVYDLTRRQFFPDATRVFEQSLTELHHDWSSIRLATA